MVTGGIALTCNDGYKISFVMPNIQDYTIIKQRYGFTTIIGSTGGCLLLTIQTGGPKHAYKRSVQRLEDRW